MFSDFLSLFRSTRSAQWTCAGWTLAELEQVLASERSKEGLPRTPYPWLAGVKPLPSRKGRPPLRLVVNN